MKNLNYDSKYDILYIGLGDGSNSFGNEEIDGFVVLRDKLSNNITGLTIFDFFRKYQSSELPTWPEGIAIDIECDIIPFVQM